MSRLPMLPDRVPATAARLSRPEDLGSVAESLYEESLGDDAGSMLCQLPTSCTERTAKYSLGRRWQPSPSTMGSTSPMICGGPDDARRRFVSFWGLSRNLLLDQSIAGFDPELT
jgi:hypothetical protein